MRTESDIWISSVRFQRRSALLLFGLLLGYVPGAQADSGWSPTATQGITLTNFAIQAQSLGPLPGTTPLRVVLGMQLQNEAQLNSAILAINTPGNPSYGKFVTPSQFAAANHVASVTVTDSEGGTASATVTVKTTQ
jgi:hypothetical protein